MMVLRKMMNLACTKLAIAIVWLLIGAIFFCMRSCEYLQTCKDEEKKTTRIIRLGDIKFKLRGKMLKHSAKNLEKADIVMITFRFQKNDWRSQTVHIFKTNDTLLCPVKSWAKTIQRITKTVPEFSDDTPVCAFWDGKRVILLSSDVVREKLRTVVDLMGEVVLGFSQDEAGLHSIQAGGAMAMFLLGICEIIIQRVGRWSSFAFLEYIREQVECFTAGVSQKMLAYECYHHINEKTNKKEMKKESTKNEDGPNLVDYNIRLSRMVLSDTDIKKRTSRPK